MANMGGSQQQMMMQMMMGGAMPQMGISNNRMADTTSQEKRSISDFDLIEVAKSPKFRKVDPFGDFDVVQVSQLRKRKSLKDRGKLGSFDVVEDSDVAIDHKNLLSGFDLIENSPTRRRKK